MGVVKGTAGDGCDGMQFTGWAEAPGSTRTSTNICVSLRSTFPTAEMVKGSCIKSGTIPFRYNGNDLRAAIQVIE